MSRGLAEALWPRGSPVGRQLFQPGNPGQPETALTVVGMVGDTRLSLAQPAAQTLYFPQAQATYADVAIPLRARSNPDALVAPLRQVVAALDPSLPLADVATMPALMRRNTAAARFRTLLLGLFALLALLLSVAGIAAVTAFSVTRRTRDYGVRMALGAAPRAIAREVLGGSLRPLMLGLAVGTAAALALTRVLAHWLYAMSPRDPLTFAGAAVLLAAACLAACWWPARRAARFDPALTLRHD